MIGYRMSWIVLLCVYMIYIVLFPIEQYSSAKPVDCNYLLEKWAATVSWLLCTTEESCVRNRIISAK